MADTADRESKLIAYFLFFSIATLLIVLGATFNYVAINTNDCKMPIKLSYSTYDKEYVSFTDNSEVNHWYLSDILHIGNMMYSIGDLIMYSAIAIMAFCGINLVILIRQKHIERRLLIENGRRK